MVNVGSERLGGALVERAYLKDSVTGWDICFYPFGITLLKTRPKY